MPGTSEELVAVARGLLSWAILPDAVEDIVWADGTPITEEERRNCFALSIYEIRLQKTRRPKAQRRAMRLLRQHLSVEQRRQLNSCRYFYVQADSGAMYRLCPATGCTDRVERHGKHWFESHSYCLHDVGPLGETLPGADLSLAHLLLLSCDEAGFLAEANVTVKQGKLWNGDWRRRLNQARREREAQREAAA